MKKDNFGMKVDHNHDMALQIRTACDSIKELLVSKNKDYGDSALNPANVFAKGSAVDNLCARIDDKIMRIANRGLNKNTLDTVDDLIGYLVLLKIALKKELNEIDNRSPVDRSRKKK